MHLAERVAYSSLFGDGHEDRGEVTIKRRERRQEEEEKVKTGKEAMTGV